MRFTVIGASGFIGRHLAAHLRARGLSCRTPERGAPALLDEAHEHVVYCAGYTADFLADPAATVEAHVGLLTDLLRRGRFATLTYLSSTRLYDFTDDPAREDARLRLSPHLPRNLFDLSKALGESLCIHAGRAGVRAVRLASVYADAPDGDGFLHAVIRAARSGRDARFDVAPDTARDYIHVEDVCRLLVAVAERGRRPIYNLAAGVNIANAALFEAVQRLCGVRLEATRPPAGMPAPRIDITAIVEDFGLRPAPLWQHLPRLLAAGRAARHGETGTAGPAPAAAVLAGPA
ncbi:MAG: NAD(P)-dependent oxidoreductase [Rhodospirillaceae bacterium]|nr:NAD(P)-dependent oxidoreductase [Rhodospirillaceae bacterium]